jgi:hypothetical protein
MKTSRSPLLLFPLLLSFLVTGCGLGKPSKDEVLNHLNTRHLKLAAKTQQSRSRLAHDTSKATRMRQSVVKAGALMPASRAWRYFKLIPIRSAAVS